MVKNIKHYFPGANTSKGFFNNFNYILDLKTANRLFCIKGGPGTGKSSFMKKIGEHYKEKGYEVEFHHCSSDDNSLDAVVVKELKIALLDGTSPHVTDPKYPGVVDEVLNFGICWFEDKLLHSKDDIIYLTDYLSNNFARAYKYMGAAKLIFDDWSFLNSQGINKNKLNLLKEDLKNKIFTTPIGDLGSERHLFATGFTPNGIVTYAKNIIEDCKNVYVLNGAPGTGKNEVLTYLKNEALRRNLDVSVFHTPLIPENIEHIVIPKISTAIVTSNAITNVNFDGLQIYMTDYMNLDLVTESSYKIVSASQDFYYMLNKGLSILTHSKEMHDKLEEHFIPSMDFAKLDLIFNYVTEKVSEYEKAIITE